MELMEFLTSLGADPRKAAELKERPIEVLNEAGLSEEDKKLILSGDPVALHSAITRAATLGEAPVTVTTVAPVVTPTVVMLIIVAV